MPSFKQRSYQKELLDGNQVPFVDIQLNMQELKSINKWLGGHKVTIAGIEKILNCKKELQELHVVEIGSGGGDNLVAIKTWADKKNIKLQLTGIDINADCIAYARKGVSNDIQFIHSDYRNYVFNKKPDIIFSSLFCHHFTNEELVVMLQWMHQNSSIGFFINDLHRHPMAYYSIKILTAIFSNSYLVRNDAPLSVLRGFKKKDWKLVFIKAGISNFECEWRWAFRWLLTSCT